MAQPAELREGTAPTPNTSRRPPLSVVENAGHTKAPLPEALPRGPGKGLTFFPLCCKWSKFGAAKPTGFGVPCHCTSCISSSFPAPLVRAAPPCCLASPEGCPPHTHYCTRVHTHSHTIPMDAHMCTQRHTHTPHTRAHSTPHTCTHTTLDTHHICTSHGPSAASSNQRGRWPGPSLWDRGVPWTHVGGL